MKHSTIGKNSRWTIKTLLSGEYKEAREQYLSMLTQKKVMPSNFFAVMTKLIDMCPYFIPPYLEILENLEGHSLVFDYGNFLKISTEVIVSAYINTDTKVRDTLAQMNYHEVHAFYWLMRRIMANKRSIVLDTFSRHYRLAGLSDTVREVYLSLPLFTTQTHLRCVDRNVPVDETVGILKLKEHYWYAYNDRQEAIYNHRATQTIVLREMPCFEEKPVPVEGNHESILTDMGKMFSNILQFIENFAETKHAGLGRVVLVRLRPKSIVYRHFDGEKYLRGRTRYHLVLQCKPGNILMSGVDFVQMGPGELWLYDNKVLHRSINDSTDWRTHVIFDMYDITTHANTTKKKPP